MGEGHIPGPGSALGPDVPHADLYVTQARALLIDGVLVLVCPLINDTSITLYDPGELEALEFFHIKLELHDVIYAEGTPCETLVSVDEDAANFAEYLRQYGPPMIEDARCAPWVGFGRRIAIKSCSRSAISPWIYRRQKFDVIRDKLEERGIAGSIPHSDLLKSVARRVVDRRVLHLIKMWLDCPVEPYRVSRRQVCLSPTRPLGRAQAGHSRRLPPRRAGCFRSARAGACG
jgi:hypothetical protein